MNTRVIMLIGTFIIILLSTCCKKEEPNPEPATIPSISTTNVSAIKITSATCGGNVSNDGGTPIIVRGVCWSTQSNPTILDNYTQDGCGVGISVSTLTNLRANITYYVRAYATNSIGTAYGNDVTFIIYLNQPGSPVTDIDGNVYHTVTIGSQVWMVENLNTTRYRDGTNIENITDYTIWSNLIVGAYSDYLNSPSSYTTYGRLYNWYAVNDAHNICPTGWHVPIDAEWTTLITFLEFNEGNKLKERGTVHWVSSSTIATNETGFTALAGGFRQDDGAFNAIRIVGSWWSASENNTTSAWGYDLNSYGNIFRDYTSKRFGCSLRCIMD